MNKILFYFIGCAMILGIFSCSDRIVSIESVKTIDDYPAEITMDNWEEFVDAPQEVLDYHTQLKLDRASKTQLKIDYSESSEESNLMPPSAGLVNCFKWGGNSIWTKELVSIPDISVSECFEITTTNEDLVFNYYTTGECSSARCMSANTALYSDNLFAVTTADVLKIQNHILNSELFTEAAQYIAADVNRDGLINGVDMIVIRKMELGKITDWVGKSDNWVFVPISDYNNLIPQGLVNLQSVGTTPNCLENAAFRVAVKTGDVNGSAPLIW